MPARFSCRIVFSFESLICTCMNIGWAIRPKIMKMMKASGSTGRIDQRQLEVGEQAG